MIGDWCGTIIVKGCQGFNNPAGVYLFMVGDVHQKVGGKHPKWECKNHCI